MWALSLGVVQRRGRWVTIKAQSAFPLVWPGMTLFWRKTAVVAASLLFLLVRSAAAQNPAAKAPGASPAPTAGRVAHGVGRKQPKSKPSPLPAPEPAPPVPLTPEQMPPVPPQVSYRNGLLTIVATNSTLSDILRAVSVRTGATVDAPAHLVSERVAARIGPGTPREVLSDLLTGPRFDYILVGSDGDPNGVRSIILTPNQSSPSTGAAMAQQLPARSVMPPQEETDEEAEDQPSPVPEVPQPSQPAQQVPPGQRPFMRPQPPDQMGGEAVASPEGAGQQPQVKTPEQLLEQLRRLQQQDNPRQNEPQR